MANVKRLKRKLLRQAVQENLETLQGLPPRSRTASRRSRLARGILFVTLPLVAIAGSSYFLSRAVSASDAVAIAPQLLEPPSLDAVAAAPLVASETAPPETALSKTAVEPASLPAPERIDPSLLSLGVRRIVLDPGHGGENSGTVAPGGLMEKSVTLDVALRLRRLLERDSFEVLMTREDDESLGLSDRTQFANENRADIFVSIHVNWIETRQVRGVETFYLGPTDDPTLSSIVAAENRGSEYSLADFRDLLEGLYQGVRQDESRELAQAVQGDLFRSLRQITPQLKDRGVKTAPFLVLVSSQMPAILVEVSCLSNEEEARLLTKPYYRQFIAQALYRGIRQYAKSLEPADPSSPREEIS